MRFIRRSTAAAAAVTALLVATAAACGPSDDNAGSKPSGSASESSAEKANDGGLKLPKGIPTSLDDLKKWKAGGWKDWDHWAAKAGEFSNPIIKDLWKPSRMAKAEDPKVTVSTQAGEDQGATDPVPAPVRAKEVKRPYHQNMAPIGKVFFDGPKGPMVCSGTVIEDPAHPGKSNLVWTAGHCVHAGTEGGWYRNITFVPSYNDNGVSPEETYTKPSTEITPYGKWWADWSQTSSEWIDQGTHEGGHGSPYDFAVLHVKPENGGGKSLQETVGAAVPVWFGAPSASGIDSLGAYGYPQAPPYDGVKMMSCLSKPGRVTLFPGQPTSYRIGCTMTGGTSGGGWFVNRGGKTTLISNSSIGGAGFNWLAGPHLGTEAKGVFDAISKKYASTG